LSSSNVLRQQLFFHIFQRIARTKAEPEDVLKLKELSALPTKYTDGTIILVSASLSTALGLGGRGMYARYGGAWNRLG
jgi:hypothetical protein